MAEGQGSDKAMLQEQQDPGRRLTFGLNPTQVTFSRAVKFQREPNQGSHSDPPAQFQGTDPTSLTLQLLLDGVGDPNGGGVQAKIDQLVAWTTIPPGNDSQSVSPPKLVFSWGSLRITDASTFVGYLEQLKVTIEMFARDGVPLRASVNLTLKSAADDPAGTNPTSGTERSYRRRVLERGQNLQSLAYDELGDAGAWRAVAEMNGIDDPLRLRTGTEVLIPDRSELTSWPR